MHVGSSAIALAEKHLQAGNRFLGDDPCVALEIHGTGAGDQLRVAAELRRLPCQHLRMPSAKQIGLYSLRQVWGPVQGWSPQDHWPGSASPAITTPKDTIARAAQVFLDRGLFVQAVPSASTFCSPAKFFCFFPRTRAKVPWRCCSGQPL